MLKLFWHIKDDNARCAARSDVASIIKYFVIKGGQIDNVDKFTNDILDKSMSFVKNYESHENAKKFVVMRSDKGQQTVVLYIDDYENGMHKLLDDKINYKMTDRDPTASISKKNNKLIIKQSSHTLDRP
jgi:hypothetical protein